MSSQGQKGRSTYTREIADEICRRLAKGESLRSICRTPGMPPESTVRTWAREDRDGFAARYARARDIGLDAIADELLEIADNASGDWQRDKLRIDARKWYLSKLAPKRYGNRLTHEVTGKPEAPFVVIMREELPSDVYGNGDDERTINANDKAAGA